MKPIDYAKAAGIGLLVMVLTLAVTFPMVAVYAYLIEPGHPQAYYNEAALWIAPWSPRTFGPILFLLINWWCAKRRPQRNGYLFAAATFAAFLLIDGGSTLLFGMSLTEFLVLPVLIQMIAMLAAALAGAWLGQRRNNNGAAA